MTISIIQIIGYKSHIYHIIIIEILYSANKFCTCNPCYCNLFLLRTPCSKPLF